MDLNVILKQAAFILFYYRLYYFISLYFFFLYCIILLYCIYYYVLHFILLYCIIYSIIIESPVYNIWRYVYDVNACSLSTQSCVLFWKKGSREARVAFDISSVKRQSPKDDLTYTNIIYDRMWFFELDRTQCVVSWHILAYVH